MWSVFQMLNRDSCSKVYINYSLQKTSPVLRIVTTKSLKLKKLKSDAHDYLSTKH